MPLAVYARWAMRRRPRSVYFMAGIVALIWGLMVPWATRFIPRRWAYTGRLRAVHVVGMALAIIGTTWSVPLALICNAMATATTFVCFNAYVLDYVDRANLGRSQSTQMVYAAAPWAIGPLTGVWLHRPVGAALRSSLAGVFALLLVVFWVLRLGNGKQIQRAKRPAVNPLGYLGRFFRQPRLIAGWMFAVMRSLRLVGLCRLSADLLHRGGPGRQGGRHCAVGDQRPAVRCPRAEPAGAQAVGAAVGPLCLWRLRSAVSGGGLKRLSALGDGCL
jgi:ACDE family multidrug resistance protein